MNEPSILDYLKSKLMPWRGVKIEIPPAPPVEQGLQTGEAEDRPTVQPEQLVSQSTQNLTATQVPEHSNAQPVDLSLAPAASVPAVREQAASGPLVVPLRSLAAAGVALIAQLGLEPPRPYPAVGIFLYGISASLLGWAILSKEWALAPLAEDTTQQVDVQVKWKILLSSLPLVVVSFLSFGGNLFTVPNLAFWALTIVYVFYAVWQPSNQSSVLARAWSHVVAWVKNPTITIRISPWTMLFIAAIALVVFFRVYRLSQVPGEMFSDHAEKLLDVNDVLNGQTHIFFPRNTGREAIQMYLTAAISVLFNTGLSFISLKMGTAFIGLLTLPFVYLLGKEIAGRWVGFLAFLMTGIAYWANLVARIGLRFPLYAAFTAPVLYFFIRGLRYQKRNDFILAGLFLGLGLHGYSPMRIIPFVLAILLGLYLLHASARGKRKQVLIAFVVLAIVAVIIFLPLGRYMLDNFESFNERALTRVGTAESPYPAPVWLIFIQNTWKAWIMPFWDNGDIWVHSVVGRPSLDVVAAAFYFLGTLQVLVRYLRKRHWIDLFLLVSVPLLMLPSILSLAFPGENPSLNRTDAAFIPVFVLVAIGIEGVLGGFNRLSNSRYSWAAAGVLGVLLIGWSASNNANLVFNQFDQQFMQGAWNTSQIGQVVHDFTDSIGTPDSAYVIPFPYWVDTRLVGINAGYPTKDYALNRDQIETTLNDPHAKLFIFKPEDTDTLNVLKNLYPDGKSVLHKSVYDGKDFVAYLVPPVLDEIEQAK
ncbi:MAG TPA: glycosyltransferase family 39 protein [Anaerolineaceae bacterium]|nr:glycosyltransferase family 39 protein [Anaerolineaceae bacterium]